MTNLKDLREQRGRLVTEMRGMLDAAGVEKRDLTGEEQAKYDVLFAEQDKVAQQVSREERQLELDRRMAESSAGAEQEQAHTEGVAGIKEDRARPRATPEYRAAFLRFLLGGTASMMGEEVRSLQAGVDPSGGI